MHASGAAACATGRPSLTAIRRSQCTMATGASWRQARAPKRMRRLACALLGDECFGGGAVPIDESQHSALRDLRVRTRFIGDGVDGALIILRQPAILVVGG